MSVPFESLLPWFDMAGLSVFAASGFTLRALAIRWRLALPPHRGG